MLIRGCLNIRCDAGALFILGRCTGTSDEIDHFFCSSADKFRRDRDGSIDVTRIFVQADDPVRLNITMSGGLEFTGENGGYRGKVIRIN